MSRSLTLNEHHHEMLAPVRTLQSRVFPNFSIATRSKDESTVGSRWPTNTLPRRSLDLGVAYATYHVSKVR